ncbi:MAG: tail fiber domain-containing protein [Saprospiraceae bacterium]|nr:tail fiber domain-containing protein [Saprospiraceae bacterium]
MKNSFLIHLLFLFILSSVSLGAQDVRISTGGNSYNFKSKNIDFNSRSIAIGNKAGENLSSLNMREIYIGNGAGEFVGGSSESIGIGYQTMSNSSGFRNIGIGMDALKFTTKWDNIAIGKNAMLNSQIGISNIAIGSYSLESDLVSWFNIGIGQYALRNLGGTGQESNNNVAVGYSSQSENLTGKRNVSVGGQSLSQGIDVTDNVAIGYNALNEGLGDQNVAVGVKALKKADLANNSVAIGYEAGFNDTLASNSVLIGYQAGRGSNKHAKSGNVFIGYQAGYNELASNKLYIDNSNTSSPLIEGNFLTNVLEINGAMYTYGNTYIDGTLTLTENATFEGSVTDFEHGNSGSSSGLVLKNSSSNDYWRMYVSSSTGDLRLFNNANGSGSTLVGKFDQVSGAYTTPSDQRLKTDVRRVESVLPALLSTQINSYKFKAQKTEQRSIGVMAQEVKEIFPELVHYDASTDSYTVDYAGFSMVALKAIQEQQSIIEELITRIEKLEDEK